MACNGKKKKKVFGKVHSNYLEISIYYYTSAEKNLHDTFHNKGMKSASYCCEKKNFVVHKSKMDAVNLISGSEIT